MSKENASLFMIMDKNTKMCLHLLEEDSGEYQYSFDHVDLSARISSVFGLSDNEFNCEGQENLLTFHNEKQAQSFIDKDLKDELSENQLSSLKVIGLAITMSVIE